MHSDLAGLEAPALEAHMRSLLPHALSQAGLLRRIDVSAARWQIDRSIAEA